MRRALSLTLLLTVLSFLARCGARSGQIDRFNESAVLSAPVTAVSPPDPGNFTFAVVGDLHIAGADTTRTRAILGQAAAESDAFFVALGDLVDQGDRASMTAFRTALSDLGWSGKTFPVIGNHDIFNDGWTAYKDLNGPSHYVFTAGNSKFIALDTADGTVSGPEREWLEAELDKPRPAHLFLVSHYLPFVPGQRTYLKLPDEREATHLMKLAATHGVTAWMGGHYHSFAIGQADGVSYVCAGGGGGRRMEPVTSYFFVQVTVAGDSVSYQLRTVP